MAAGLRAGGAPAAGGVAPGVLALAAAAACALAALRGGLAVAPSAARGSARRSRHVLALAAAAALWAGLGLGLRDAARAGASCTSALRTGDGVVVEGEASTAVRPASRARSPPGERWARLELYEAQLRRGGHECRVPRVLVRVLRPPDRVRAGTRVRAVGEWRRFAPAGRRVPRAVDRYGAAYGTLASREAEGGSGGTAATGRSRARRAADRFRRLRAGAASRLERLVPLDALPAAKALVLAERSDLSPEVTRRFADAGMIHLLAISGLHVGLLAGGALWAAGLVVGRRARWPAAALATAAYVTLIGAPPPAVRAALLFGGLAATRMRGSPSRPGDLLGWAVGISLVGSPLLLVNPGYQLSFAGFVGLLGGDRAALRLVGEKEGSGRGSRRGRILRRRLRGATRALGASFGAFLCTAPIAAAHFGRVAPASVVSSLVGAPLVALALAGLVPALLLPGAVGSLAAAGAAVPIRALLRVAELFAGLPLHGTAAPPDAAAWGAVALVGVGSALLLGAEPGGRASRARGALCLVGAAALWTAAPGLRALGRGGAAVLCSLDVGQGDAAVLRTGGGHWIVFDAGPGPGFARGRPGRARVDGERGAAAGRGVSGPPAGSWDAGARVVVPFLRDRGARSVELFVLSHPHLDHLGGAAAVFEAFRVKRVLDAGTPLPSGAYLRYLGAVEEEGARWLPARAGARMRVDGVEILVLGPAGGAGGGDGRPIDPNDVSVAVRVRVGPAFAYVNTGDAPAATEAEILRGWPADTLRADLLKLGHHGSRTSTSGPWLAATRPELAIVSVGGRNRYGHPHPSTLARLDSAGVPRLWRTDRQGTMCVRVEKDGRWRLVPG